MQEKITESEWIIWSLYRRKYGPLNPVRKYDRPASLIATILSNVHGGKAKMTDFQPYGREDEEDQEIDSNAFVNLLLATGAQVGR